MVSESQFLGNYAQYAIYSKALVKEPAASDTWSQSMLSARCWSRRVHIKRFMKTFFTHNWTPFDALWFFFPITPRWQNWTHSSTHATVVVGLFLVVSSTRRRRSACDSALSRQDAPPPSAMVADREHSRPDNRVVLGIEYSPAIRVRICSLCWKKLIAYFLYRLLAPSGHGQCMNGSFRDMEGHYACLASQK